MNITIPRKTVQQVLDTLKSFGFSDGSEVVAALRTALEAAAREPVATLTIGVEDSERGTAKFNLLNYNLPVGEYKLFLQSGAAPKGEQS